jgi:hypothetical protein
LYLFIFFIFLFFLFITFYGFAQQRCHDTCFHKLFLFHVLHLLVSFLLELHAALNRFGQHGRIEGIVDHGA